MKNEKTEFTQVNIPCVLGEILNQIKVIEEEIDPYSSSPVYELNVSKIQDNLTDIKVLLGQMIGAYIIEDPSEITE